TFVRRLTYSRFLGGKMKQINFRINDNEYELYHKKVKENLNMSLPSFYKLVGNMMLNKDKDIKETLSDHAISIGEESDYTDKRAYLYLTAEQENALITSAKKHGWSLSREMRFRLQTTLSNEMDFFDQELQEMKLCRNHIKRIGLNINMILRRDEGRVLDKEGMRQDMQALTEQLNELENKFNYFINKCKGRIIANRL
ncbi:TPA: DNA distortion polypeptide 1, partial [Proteus mirabilis]